MVRNETYSNTGANKLVYYLKKYQIYVPKFKARPPHALHMRVFWLSHEFDRA